MSSEFLVLASRIDQELAALEQTMSRAERALRAANQQRDDADLYIDAVALNLHDLYTGLERIFRGIVTIVDKSMPSGEGWHRDLLQQMCLDLPAIRPRVLTEETCRALEDFLRFRHVVRNIYAFQFDAERVNQLTQEARVLLNRITEELEHFKVFLTQIAQE